MNRRSRLTRSVLSALSGTELTVPTGTVLFHGTMEDFQDDQLGSQSHGGEAGILWLSDSSLISQTYIPTAGAKTHMSARYILHPSRDPLIQKLQKQLGIDYHRLEETDWSSPHSDDAPHSFWPPRGWAGQSDNGRLFGPAAEAELIRRMKELGYGEPRSQYNPSWSIQEDKNGNPQPPSFREQGKLFIITVKSPLRIFDFTYGEKTEGDLMDVDYHRYEDFSAAYEKGYDGVKINDFAQSNDYGNVGHTSIGVFQRAVPKLAWKAIPAIHQDLEPLRGKKWISPEYEQYQKENGGAV